MLCYLAFILFTSCLTTKNYVETNYYEIVPELGYHLYATSACKGETIGFIPAGVPVYTKYPGRKKSVLISYGSLSGYVRVLKYGKSKNTGYTILPAEWIETQNKQLAEYNKKKSSIQSSSLSGTSTGGSVQVKGYYRKDGTYVRPHTRSAPTRKY
ncbi:hypothetical protein EGT74_24865 [Chitinophaga lutea]|uniref:Uncharacterized protein n=2 Tax=Chitinophaga lutea TaxID=2488634 RepID=A0A3N4PAD8_9BACT|nr:hypothetical protein EGT74_24865 [Chitinophaga lutea]